MGKGGKKATKLVKPEQQEKGKKFENEEGVINVRQPSPIPEEAESGFAAQSSAHGDGQGATNNDFWNAGGDPQVWQGSAHASRGATPRPEHHKSIGNLAAPGGPSQPSLSWTEQPDTGSSLDQSHSHQYPSSPHPGQTRRQGANTPYADFDRGDPGWNEEAELDYVTEEQSSGMDPSLNIHQQRNPSAQVQSHTAQQAPPTHVEQRPPAFPIYATSLSTHPVAPNPPPAPPNVVSRASDAAARRDKTKQGDLPPQPAQAWPLRPAAWHSWLKPGTYAPAPGPPAPPPAPPLAPISENISVPKPPRSNPARGVWDMKYGKGQPASAWPQQPRGRANVLPGQEHQRQGRLSADGWDNLHGKGNHDAWNGGGWEQAGTGGGWYGDDGGKKGHGRSKSAGGWTRKRNVQWEEESSNDDTEDDEDDGWGGDEAGQRVHADGWNKPNDGWNKPNDGWNKPNDGWNKPSDGWNKPNDGWNKPNDGWNKPNDGWNKMNDGWGKSGWDDTVPKPDQGWGTVQDGWNQGKTGWADPSNVGHGWGEGRKAQNVVHGPSINIGTRPAVSPQQKSQIMNSLLDMTDHRRADQAARLGPKNNRPEGRRQTVYNAGWGLEDDSWGTAHDNEDHGRGNDRRLPSVPSKGASNTWDAWAGSQDVSRYSMPSLTLAHAYKDTKTRIDSGAQHKLDDFTRIRFHESGGTALIPAHNAFFNHSRLARDRIYWLFPPDKDERVRAALTWVQEMSYGLGTLGLHKFLQHRERGALVINADHKLPDKPNEFAVDYLTFDDLQKSMDKTLQASVISYDPSITVIVFVFLPSKTGNSIAAWRRKLLVPNNSRLRFQKELSITLPELQDPKKYLVHVDELPGERKDLAKSSKDTGQKKAKMKRKWWQFFARSKS